MKFNKNFIVIILFTFFSYSQVPIIQWQKTYGGSNIDHADFIQQTKDGGYIVLGYTYSTDGDLAGTNGDADCWLVKLSSTGIIEWKKRLNLQSVQLARCVIQTTDGGYIISVLTHIDVMQSQGYYVSWIAKLSSIGNIEWQNYLKEGGAFTDILSIIQINDGGYILAGYTSSNSGDYLVVKLTSNGIIEWKKNLGGTSKDYAYSIQETNDGGFILAGNTLSNNGDVSGNHGGSDYWIVKLTSTGLIEWQKTLGGSSDDNGRKIIQTIDGGFITIGNTLSNDGDLSGNHGGFDYWIVKLTSTGLIEWQKNIGGLNDEDASDIIQTIDGGYILAGSTLSNDGDVSENHGGKDCWIVKLTINGLIEWQKTFGGSKDEGAASFIQTNDGGYMIATFTSSNDGDVSGNHGVYDFWIVKLSRDTLALSLFNQNTSITLFPNPVKDKLTIKLDTFTSNKEISITDISGKTIHIQQTEGLITNINTSSFQKGIYFLNLINDGTKTTKKFIVK